MMLLRLLRSSVTANALALLVTSLSFTAAMYRGEASSSAGPSAGPYGSEIVPSGLDLDTYIGRLNVENMDQLRPSFHTSSSLHLLPDAPFYGDIPILTTGTPPETVERALVDHRNVYILDLQHTLARQVTYHPSFERGILQQSRNMPPRFAQKLSFINSFGPNVHVLMKHFQKEPWDERWPRSLPAHQSVEFLPHLDGVPILESGTDNLGHMLRASKTGPQMFWLRRPGDDYLINPHVQPSIHENTYVRPVIESASESQKQKIERVVRGFDAAKRKYGEATASIIWGQPIRLSSRYQTERINDPPLHMYKRYAIQDRQLSLQEQRDELKRSLQSHGRYRLYDTINPENGPYKVKLENLGAPPGTIMKINVKPLTFAEKMKEEAAAMFHRFSLPH